MMSIKDKIKKYKSMIIISDDGFQAVVHTDNYMGSMPAFIIYSNDNGDGMYGKPVAAIFGSAYDAMAKINK